MVSRAVLFLFVVCAGIGMLIQTPLPLAIAQ